MLWLLISIDDLKPFRLVVLSHGQPLFESNVTILPVRGLGGVTPKAG